jgi:ABC-type dipeptide/oligopeptide/nickel transport system ATPase component
MQDKTVRIRNALLLTPAMFIVTMALAIPGCVAPSGCRFRDRCPHAFERCAVEAPKPIRVGTRRVECHLFDG